MSATSETVAIPQAMRDQVDARDGGFCRLCGRFLGERRAIHHINFGGDAQGMGGRRLHELDNLVSLCWQPGDNGCHSRAHSLKHYWALLLSQVIKHPGRTALQLERWTRRSSP